MAAKPRVTRDDIITVLRIWRGDVKNAANDLGITRKALYGRIRTLGLDLDDYRSNSEVTFTSRGVYTMTTPVRVDSLGTRVPDSQCVNLKHPDPGTRLNSMVARVGAVVENLGSEIRQRAQQPPRLRPEQVDELQALRLKFQGLRGVEITNSALLQWLYTWAKDSFAAEILKPSDNGGAAK